MHLQHLQAFNVQRCLPPQDLLPLNGRLCDTQARSESYGHRRQPASPTQPKGRHHHLEMTRISIAATTTNRLFKASKCAVKRIVHGDRLHSICTVTGGRATTFPAAVVRKYIAVGRLCLRILTRWHLYDLDWLGWGQLRQTRPHRRSAQTRQCSFSS